MSIHQHLFLETHETFAEFVNKYVTSHMMLGTGAFSKVFQHPLDDKKVIKIGVCKKLGDPDPILPEQDGYFNYLLECLVNQHNPFFPKIHDFHFYWHELDKQYYYMVVLERLIDDFSELLGDQVKQKCLENNGFDSVHSISGFVVTNDDRQIKTLSKTFKQARVILRRLFDNFSEDLHRGNIMWRLKDTKEQIELVITDPVC